MADFPLELVGMILSKLPVPVALAVGASTCKAWRLVVPVSHSDDDINEAVRILCANGKGGHAVWLLTKAVRKDRVMLHRYSTLAVSICKSGTVEEMKYAISAFGENGHKLGSSVVGLTSAVRADNADMLTWLYDNGYMRLKERAISAMRAACSRDRPRVIAMLQDVPDLLERAISRQAIVQKTAYSRVTAWLLPVVLAKGILVQPAIRNAWRMRNEFFIKQCGPHLPFDLITFATHPYFTPKCYRTIKFALEFHHVHHYTQTDPFIIASILGHVYGAAEFSTAERLCCDYGIRPFTDEQKQEFHRRIHSETRALIITLLEEQTAMATYLPGI